LGCYIQKFGTDYFTYKKNLFNQAIKMAEDKGFVVVISDDGVLSANKNLDFNVDEVREVDRNNTDKTNNCNDLLSVIKE
jgi:hypothetical protein